ncbi:glycosyltransferase family 2 protein [Marinibacterium sp. SX1]|uniref:glycosyltransferase family 2 protein n=1 Tax=Marinibacterium sp. SX1 TaxID=3388424 RepID=UPI003D1671EE
MDRAGPQISVVIAAWNAAATIGHAIDSVLAQQGVTVEVIVVDDASTDNTLDLAREVASRDARVIVLAQPLNRGPAAARNRALDAARAPYVALLDSDDAMGPTRLGELLEMARAGDWDMVADDLYKVTSHAPTAPRQRLLGDRKIGLETIDFQGFVRGNLSRLHGGRGEMGFLKPLMRKEFLDRHGLRYDETMRLGEDYALYATALARGARFCLTDPRGYLALVRPDSLSGRHSAADLAALVGADHALADEPGLSRADRQMLRAHEIETQKRWRWVRLIEAVKARDAGDALRCFRAPPAVVVDLVGKLSEQVVLRSLAAIRRRDLAGSGDR